MEIIHELLHLHIEKPPIFAIIPQYYGDNHLTSSKSCENECHFMQDVEIGLFALLTTLYDKISQLNAMFLLKWMWCSSIFMLDQELVDY